MRARLPASHHPARSLPLPPYPPPPPHQPQVLPLGGYVPADFEGGTSLLAEACGQDFPPCQPGEVSPSSLAEVAAAVAQMDGGAR